MLLAPILFLKNLPHCPAIHMHTLTPTTFARNQVESKVLGAHSPPKADTQGGTVNAYTNQQGTITKNRFLCNHE